MGTRSRAAIVTIALAVLFIACGPEPQSDATPDAAAMLPQTAATLPLPSVEQLRSPAGKGSGEPHLALLPDGRVAMTWLERRGREGHALRFATFDDAGWSEPVTIAERSDFFANWADFPSVVASGDILFAHWLQKSGEGKYAYDVQIVSSADGGKTWSSSIVPHRDGTQTEHGFVSLLPEPGGSVTAVWLDGRNMTASGDHGHGGGMTLRSARIGSDGSISEEVLLDELVCDCCQTAAAQIGSDIVVAYRDRSPEEIRDISVVRRVDGKWSSPHLLHADGWNIPGCPVNGPQLDSEGGTVVAAWFTAPDEGRVQVAFSSDRGETFSPPVRLDGGAPMGRVDVVLVTDRTAAVTWLEEDGEGAEVRLRLVDAAGGAGEPVTVGRTGKERASGFPRIVRRGPDVFAAWTDPSAETIHFARIATGEEKQ